MRVSAFPGLVVGVASNRNSMGHDMSWLAVARHLPALQIHACPAESDCGAG
jgi:hypothetical protein